MEVSARKLISYQEVVPGLLQTADYARALMSAFPGYESQDDIERRVQVRLKRQAILTRKSNPLELEVILHESALYRLVGSPRVMATQLRELAEVGKRPNISIRIHPYSAGCAWGYLHGQFVILDFGDDGKGNPIEPPVVYLDGGMSSDLYLDDSQDVHRYHELAEVIRRDALDEARTRELLRQVASREY